MALNGSGAVPLAARLEDYRARGEMPERGLWAAPVPGAVDAWATAISRYGSMSLGRLLQPAIYYAENGFPVSVKFSQALAGYASLFAQYPALARVYWPQGRPPQPGEIIRQPELAQSLRQVAEVGREAFYQGPIAEAILQFSQREGGLFRQTDFSLHRSQWAQPLVTDYRGYQVYAQPPVSQGHILLQELNILEDYDLANLEPALRQHLMIEAKKLAFADRLRHTGDPEWGEMPLKELLSKEYAARQRARLSLQQTAEAPEAGQLYLGGDTTYLAVADRQGNAVSFIQSLYMGFGSGVMVEGTGIVLHNRMAGMSLEDSHPNCLGPGKRPVHTLSPCLVVRENKPFLILGTPGANGQVQTNLQILCNLIDPGMDLQEVIEAPRWRHEEGLTVTLEDRFPAEILTGLEARGHQLRLVGDWSSELGGAQVIMLADGVMMGGADPRREGYAVGW